MKSKKRILEEIQNAKRGFEEESINGRFFTAETYRIRGLALCWVLDKYWGDVVLE